MQHQGAFPTVYFPVFDLRRGALRHHMVKRLQYDLRRLLVHRFFEGQAEGGLEKRPSVLPEMFHGQTFHCGAIEMVSVQPGGERKGEVLLLGLAHAATVTAENLPVQL